LRGFSEARRKSLRQVPLLVIGENAPCGKSEIVRKPLDADGWDVYQRTPVVAERPKNPRLSLSAAEGRPVAALGAELLELLPAPTHAWPTSVS
jgi:hypothetical protein